MKRRTKIVVWGAAITATLAISAAYFGGLMTRVAEPTFTVEQKDGDFEVRRYEPRVLAETVVSGDWDRAGNEAFGRLAGYIFGKNTTNAKIEMTAPVAQRAESRKLAMTAPVGQRREGDAWVVSFTMPAGETLATLPSPLDQRVTLREVPAERVMVVRFSGRWSDAQMRQRADSLRSWGNERGLRGAAANEEAEVNRYDPPWTLWFLRRNEVWIKLEGAS